MTVSDIANLLIALTSGSLAKDAPNEVRRIRQFKRRPAGDTLRTGALDGRIQGEEFGEFFERILTMEVTREFRDLVRALPPELFPRTEEAEQFARRHNIPEEIDEVTAYTIDFTIDDDWIELDITRGASGFSNFVDGALFFAEKPDFDRAPGVVTTKTLLDWAVRQMADLLRDREASD